MGTKTKGGPSPMSISGISNWPMGVRRQRFSIYSTSAWNVVLSIVGMVTEFTLFSSTIDLTQLHYTSSTCPRTNLAEFNKYMIFQSQNGNCDIALAMIIVYTTIVGLNVYISNSIFLEDIF